MLISGLVIVRRVKARLVSHRESTQQRDRSPLRGLEIGKNNIKIRGFRG